MGTPFFQQGQGGEGGAPVDNGNGGGGSGINPAWNEALQAIPSEYHEKLIPTFQKWDQNHQSGVQKVHSQYEPYKEFVDAGVDAEQLRIAMGLAHALDENPQAIYEALAEDFGPKSNGKGQNPVGEQFPGTDDIDGQGGPGSGEFEGLPPEFVERFSALEQQNNAMRDILMERHNKEQEAQEDAALDQMYKKLADENPVFRELNKDGAAEPYMNSLFMAGYDEKQAGEMFLNFVDAVKSYANRPQPPAIMGAGGFMPEQRVRPRDLSEKQTNESIVQMLQAAFHKD